MAYRSVSSREVRLHDQDALCRVSSQCVSRELKCREVTVKKKRVETFRKIYGMVTVVYIYILLLLLLLYRQRAQVARLGGLAPARPIIYILYIYGRVLHIPYISKCFYVNFFKRNHRIQRSTS